MPLTIMVRLRHGRYDAGAERPLDAEWPPHPARVFCALAASASGEADWAALRWLESQPAPQVHADPAARVRAGRASAYVVENATSARGGNQIWPGRTNGMRSRAFAVPVTDSFAVVWPHADPQPEVLAQLAGLAGKVPYVGRSTSMAEVTASATIDSRPGSWAVYQAAPLGDPGARWQLRVPYPGYADELDAAYREGRRSWEVARALPYTVTDDLAAPANAGPDRQAAAVRGPFEDLMVWSLVRPMVRIGGGQVVALAGALHKAVIARVPDPVPPQVSGHGAPGRPHVGFLALPDTGHEHADGHILGFALAVPRDLAPADLAQLVKAVILDPLSELRIGRGRALALRYGADRYGLQPARWAACCDGGTRVWATVTPLMLDGHLRRGRDEASQVARSVGIAGYPQPESVEVSQAPLVEGAVWRPRPGTLPPGRPHRRLVHARVTFPVPVTGPGAGRIDALPRAGPVHAVAARPTAPGVMMSGTATATAVTGLAEEDFAAFFQEVHGWAPFPWQQALMHRLLERGWPALIDVPTGLGKTAVLDVAVFASALRSEHARRRVFLVVDRRLIVDQAYEHAGRIQRALTGARPGSVCHAVARRLAADGDDGPVLDVTRMRGGVSWSGLWLERPDRHAIVTGTVDQVGSRLLFRGYGVGERLRPIDAALTGTGSLIIVDEAHLSDAFLSTLRDIQEHEAGRTAPPPVVVAMSASPGTAGADTHSVTSADEQDPAAAQRLAAPKRLHLVTVPAAKGAAAAAVADALAYWALRLGGPGRVTGVVANTVARARAVFGKLQQELGDRAALVLLTGRVRPVDRDYLLYDWYPRIHAGTARPEGQPLYVVATQTIEVGADVDFDTLITESASLPALLQRLGRLNRRGERPAAIAVAVHADRLNDSVYAEARPQTWQWLASLTDPVQHRHGSTAADLGPGIDGSPLALRHRAEGLPSGQWEAMRGPRPYAPLISAVTFDTWARTAPIPRPDVPIAPYLHGIGASEPTVSVIWRADARGEDPAQWSSSTDRIPPSADEAIELPVSAVRHWLATVPDTLTSGARTAAQSDADEAEALSECLVSR